MMTTTTGAAAAEDEPQIHRSSPTALSLSHIPEHLRISVLYQDDHIVVLNKPCNILSIPGNRRNNQDDESSLSSQRKRQRDNRETDTVSMMTTSRMTAQEAWVAAIRSFVRNAAAAATVAGDEIDVCLARLGARQSYIASVPRKYKSFCRYLDRNRKRILDESTEIADLNATATAMFDRIQKRQRVLINRPPSTPLEESALGQLTLMGFADNEEEEEEEAVPANSNTVVSSSHYGRRRRRRLYAVHRLDCETSGVMVVARTQQAASFLCHAWREGSQVSKTYLAQVHEWPLWQNNDQRSGEICLPLEPSPDERLKWRVAANGNGKPCTTLWKVLLDANGGSDNDNKCRSYNSTTRADASSCRSSISLELTPLSGRTHQLRVHCAAVGGGIVGDSLYGQSSKCPSSVKLYDRSEESRCLRLHAHKLSFPHPHSKEPMEFVTNPEWYSR